MNNPEINRMQEVMNKMEKRYVAPRLSKYRVGVVEIDMQSSVRKDFTHCNFMTAEVMAMYSVSVEERGTVPCLVELHEMGLAPKNNTKTPVDVLIIRITHPIRIRKTKKSLRR